MTPLSFPLLLALVVGCVPEQAPDSGVFVGNPGKLELTAAESSVHALSGTVSLSSLSLTPCGSSQTVDAPLDGRELELVEEDGLLRFQSAEPLEVPPGAWCGLTLAIRTANLVATRDGALSPGGTEGSFRLDFDDLVISVGGAELVIDEQELALQLGEPEWLAPLLDVEGTDPSGVDVAEQSPTVWAQLRDALEGRSALFLVPPDRTVDTATDQNPPESATDGTPLWSGDDREPPDTDPTPTTPSTDPVELWVESTSFPAVQLTDVDAPIRVGDTLYMAGVPGQGSYIYTLDDYAPDGGFIDPATGPIQDTATEVALTAIGDQLYLVSATPSGVAVDLLEVQLGGSLGTTPFPAGAATAPRAAPLTNGPVFTWLDGSSLQLAEGDAATQTTLASDVLEHDLATDDAGSVLLAWTEPLDNPFGGGTTALFAARLGTDQTVLFDATVAGDLSMPRIAADRSTALVTALLDGTPVASLHRLDGGALGSPSLAGSATAIDGALVDGLAILAWSNASGTFVQLFDEADGSAVSAVASLPAGPADDLHVIAWNEDLLSIRVIGLGADGDLWMAQLGSDAPL